MSTLSNDPPPVSSDRYQIGWICALPMKLAAGLVMFDQEFGEIQDKDAQDTNTYHAGRIQGHNIVIACLPDGEYGTNAAAVVATNMLRTFRNLKFGLLVGIGGGLPHPQKGQPGYDLRLGDVVVSSARATTSGVIQYDLGKQLQTGGEADDNSAHSTFRRCGQLDRPPLALRTALASLKAKHMIGRSQVNKILEKIFSDTDLKKTFRFPGRENDCLFHSTIVHVASQDGVDDCSECDITQIIPRVIRSKLGPKIFFGTILSANRVIKDPAVRDELRDQFASEGALCVEMEAAGLMNSFPCPVIRGICDYSDSHKSDAWHNYSALTAAALAKDLLSYISVEQTNKEKTVSLDDVLGFVKDQFQPIDDYIDYRVDEDRRDRSGREEEKFEDVLKACHRDLCPEISYLEAKRNIPDRAKNTCKWVLDDPVFEAWETAKHDDLLWISADPGCGKSVFSKALIDEVLPTSELQSVCYFFFNDTTGQKSLSVALCAILHQLFGQQKHLQRHAKEPYEEFGPRLKDEVDMLWKVLTKAASDIDERTRPIVCVVDALDEEANESRITLIKYLCTFYTRSRGNVSNCLSDASPRLKIIVTSRPYNTVREYFEVLSDSLPKIHLKGEEKNNKIKDEINGVVRQKARDIAKRCKLTAKTTTLLEAKLLEMEHRTYLWLYLAADDIERRYKYSIDPDSVTFDTLPGSVDDAYEQILQRVAEEARDTVQKILSIVIGATRALTISEMCIALGILNATKLDQSRLAGTCGVGAACSFSSMIVRFIYYTRLRRIFSYPMSSLVIL